MEFFALVISSINFLSLFVLGWIALTIIVGMRGGLEGAFRFFLLGVGLFIAFVALVVLLVYSPDWLAITWMLIGASLPWISLLQYFVHMRRSGDLLLSLPAKREKWSNSIRGGIAFVLLGLSLLIFENPILAAKSYALGIMCISWGVFGVIQRMRYSQVRETGILYELGNLYRWENIESYSWKFGEDKLTLKLKKSFFRRNASLKLLSQFRHEVVEYLSQKIGNTQNNEQEYLPIQKAG